ncbi:MAG: hypothetical protein AB1505_23030 [Candidatus Latescibacterota bacterium]
MTTTDLSPAPLASGLQRLYALLREMQPLPEEHDVVWQGLYYIPRPGTWCPSHFTLYRGTLYVVLHIPPVHCELSWRIGAEDVTLERGPLPGACHLSQSEWGEAIAQLEHRARSALGNPAVYSRRVERRLPPACRTGKIQRRLTWPRGTRPPLPRRDVERFRREVSRGTALPWLGEMTLSGYLDAIAVAYDAVFEDLRLLRPLEKYQRRADGRHGGLLDLPPHDAAAFSAWFHGGSWHGTHPWEIVFGHPHGIMIAPRCQADPPLWRYAMWVDSEGWYAAAARMALALIGRELPVEFHDWKRVAEALQGIDEVPVGPGLYAVGYESLGADRPDALPAIRWDPIPQVSRITPDQRARVRAGESAD